MKGKIAVIITIILLVVVDLVFLYAMTIYASPVKEEIEENPEDTLTMYFSLIKEEKYDDLVNLVNIPNSYSIDSFIARNRNIYQGIRASNINITILSTEKEDDTATIRFINKMKIRGATLEFQNTASLTKNQENHYKINWSSNLILPELNNEYKVRVENIEFERGKIIDRNGEILAGPGEIYNIGIVPGKLESNKDENITRIANLLNLDSKYIKSILSEDWVKDNTFVKIKSISIDNVELKDKLLEVPGIMIDKETTRVYPYREVAAHITGYVQGITLEELSKVQDQGYTLNSVIGKTGLEQAYEKRLRGKDGFIIYIEDQHGRNIKTLSEEKKQDGEDIHLTIDINLQTKLYEDLKNDEGLFIIMDYQSGQLLALLSTPSYDPNRFIFGMNEDEWTSLSNDSRYPLYARFTSRWCPGSTFKPLTAAIGLTSGTLSENDIFNYYGLSWKKSYWTNHVITTLSSYYGKKNLRNALVYSDNIYFAQAVLQIGEDTFTRGLDSIRFNEQIDFDIPLAYSIYSNDETISGESILADSGYGQGEILVNPIHMASIYSAFVNNGNMIKPQIELKEKYTTEFLVENAFSEYAANVVHDDLIQAVEDPSGTGHNVKVKGMTIGGKTGTAELKAPGETKGDTLGWFNCFTENCDKQWLIISMAKNQGSTYLKNIIRTLFV